MWKVRGTSVHPMMSNEVRERVQLLLPYGELKAAWTRWRSRTLKEMNYDRCDIENVDYPRSTRDDYRISNKVCEKTCGGCRCAMLE